MAGKPFSVNRRQFLQGAAGLAAASALHTLPFSVSAGGSGGGRGYPTLREGKPEDVNMSTERLEDVFARLEARANYGFFPGATALVARDGVIVGHRAFGVKVRDTDEKVTLDTLFDLESMTKVLATATSAMILVERGKLKLTDKVADYLPDFAANGKENITIADMLTYSAGLPVDNPKVDTDDTDEIWKFMAETALEYPTGTMVEYSDLTYRLLGRTVEVVSGMSLQEFAQANIWEPLGMKDTTYNPPADLKERIAATGPGSYGLRTETVRGEVQDDQDWKLGGIVGCDGVFSTAADLAVFCQMFLNRGKYKDNEILKPESVEAMTHNQTPQVTEADTDLSPVLNLLLTPKGYGWELWTHRFSSGGMRLSTDSFGKAGGAGTFMWVDPGRRLFGILLTNHALPVPFDEPGWAKMLNNIGVYEFFDGVINALTND